MPVSVEDAGGAKEPPNTVIKEGMPVFGGNSGKIALGFAVLAFVLLAFIAYQLWDFVTTADETREKEDFDQLSTIVQPLVAAAGLVLGAVFGAVTQSGASKSNAKAAESNATAAEKQKETAKSNLEAAKSLGIVLKSIRTQLSGDEPGGSAGPLENVSSVTLQAQDNRQLIQQIDAALNPPVR